MTSSSSRAVLFDVDGTLSDSWYLGFSCTQKVLEQTGFRTITEEEYHQGTKYSTPRRFAWHLTQNPEDEIGIVLGDKFDEMYVKMVTKETTALYPGILDIIKKIRHYPHTKTSSPSSLSTVTKIGALSNACGAYVQAVLNVNALVPYFDVGLGADEVPEPKPHPAGLLECCSTLSVHPSQCIYIGDSPSDAAAATAAGMKSIGVTWGSHPKETVVPVFTYTAETVTELETLILSFLSDRSSSSSL